MIFTFDEKTDYNIGGVYIYKVGNLFYIGRSQNIKKRLSQHQKTITKAVDNYSLLVNSLSDPSTLKSCKRYLHHARYILEHPAIQIFNAYVLLECSTQHNASIFETQLLRLYENHPDSLNLHFKGGIVKEHCIDV